MKTIPKKIQEIMFDSGLNVTDFAKKIGLSRQFIYNLINDIDSRGCSKKTQIETIKQICNKTGYDFQLFLEETGYIEKSKKEQPVKITPLFSDDEIQIIDAYRSMTQAEQITIKNMLNGIVASKPNIVKKENI